MLVLILNVLFGHKTENGPEVKSPSGPFFWQKRLLRRGQAATHFAALLGGCGDEALALAFVLTLARSLGSGAIRSALARVDAIAVHDFSGCFDWLCLSGNTHARHREDGGGGGNAEGFLDGVHWFSPLRGWHFKSVSPGWHEGIRRAAGPGYK
jgi:hypothetical protein